MYAQECVDLNQPEVVHNVEVVTVAEPVLIQPSEPLDLSMVVATIPVLEEPIAKPQVVMKRSIADLFNNPDQLSESIELEAGDKQVDLSDNANKVHASQPQCNAKVFSYLDKVNLETQDALKRNLEALFEFGFTEFEQNKELLIKHNMDIEAVASELMN